MPDRVQRMRSFPYLPPDLGKLVESIAISPLNVPVDVRLVWAMIYPPAGSAEIRNWTMVAPINHLESTPVLYLEFIRAHGFKDAKLDGEPDVVDGRKLQRIILREANRDEVIERL